MLRDYVVETIETNDGHLIDVGYDSDAPNPREEYDNFGTMMCRHDRYTLGDVEPDSRIESFEVLTRYYAGTSGIFLPLYLLDHSGLYLRTYRGSEYMGLDTSMIGIIFATKEQIIAEYGDDSPDSRAKALDLLYAEVREYGAYLAGETYYFEIRDVDDDLIDACGGFYDLDECIAAATAYTESLED